MQIKVKYGDYDCKLFDKEELPTKNIKMLELPFVTDSEGNLYWLMKFY